MILVVLLCAAIHSGYIGSKVVVSLLAINLANHVATWGDPRVEAKTKTARAGD